jgi:hypothetical protein
MSSQYLWDRLPEARTDPNYVMPEDDVFQIFNSGTSEVLKTMPAWVCEDLVVQS